MTRITVDLTEDEAEYLIELSQKEQRHPRQQAAFLLQQQLKNKTTENVAEFHDLQTAEAIMISVKVDYYYADMVATFMAALAGISRDSVLESPLSDSFVDFIYELIGTAADCLVGRERDRLSAMISRAASELEPN